MKRPLIAGMLAAALGTLCIGHSAQAADHGDAPAVRLHVNEDINDVYLFKSPANANNTVMIMTVSPVAGITGPLVFDSTGTYEFAVDNNADAAPDIVYSVKFGKADANGVQKYTITEGTGKKGKKVQKLGTGSTGADVTLKNGGTARAEVFDDPFFFDLLSFRNSLAFCGTTAANFFRGLNTLAIVMEVPTSELQNGSSTSFGIWARTFETQTRALGRIVTKTTKQLDRMGRPAINTVLVTSANKDAFNRASPAGDKATYAPDAIAIMTSLGNSAGAQTVANILFPDILTIDVASDNGFPNGRKLTDDVIDTALQLVTGNNAASDCIANDSTFRLTFPYLGVKNP